MLERGNGGKAARQKPPDGRHQTDSRLCQWLSTRGSKYISDALNMGFDDVLEGLIAASWLEKGLRE